MERIADSEAATETRISAAIVVSATIESFDRLKKEAERLGCKIIYQMQAPKWVKLWIVERGRDGP